MVCISADGKLCAKIHLGNRNPLLCIATSMREASTWYCTVTCRKHLFPRHLVSYSKALLVEEASFPFRWVLILRSKGYLCEKFNSFDLGTSPSSLQTVSLRLSQDDPNPIVKNETMSALPAVNMRRRKLLLLCTCMGVLTLLPAQ